MQLQPMQHMVFVTSEEAGVYSSQQLSDTAAGTAKLSASMIPRKDRNH